MDVGLGASLLQLRNGKQFSKNEHLKCSTAVSSVFTSRMLTSADTHYSNIEREVLGILYSWEKIHS